MGERFEVREMEEIETYWGPTHTRFYLWGSPAQQCILFDARTTTTNNREIVGEQICPCRSSGTSAKFWLRVTCMNSAHFFFFISFGDRRTGTVCDSQTMRANALAQGTRSQSADGGCISYIRKHWPRSQHAQTRHHYFGLQTKREKECHSKLFVSFFFFASIFIHFHPLFIWDRLRSQLRWITNPADGHKSKIYRRRERKCTMNGIGTKLMTILSAHVARCRPECVQPATTHVACACWKNFMRLLMLAIIAVASSTHIHRRWILFLLLLLLLVCN